MLKGIRQHYDVIKRRMHKGYLVFLQISLWPALSCPSEHEPALADVCLKLPPSCCTCIKARLTFNNVLLISLIAGIFFEDEAQQLEQQQEDNQ